jgi:hypothetical protein
MTEPVRRPERPRVLIFALVLLPLAAVFFGMTATNLGAAAREGTGIQSLAFFLSLLAIRFHWARVASVVLLAWLVLLWLPGAIRFAGDPGVSLAASYTLIGTPLFVVGAVLVFHPASSWYYGQAASWREDRRRRRRAPVD